MLVHICCSVDSHYFLQRLGEEYPNEELVGYFYDPNIHPYSEYRLRFLDVQYSCKKLGITLLEGPYDLEAWLTSVKGLENEPEKGDRCTVCFDKRLETTVKKALELGHESFTTTLLISPKKSQEKLQTIGEHLSDTYGINWVFKDYRSGSGMQNQAQVVKEHALYRQNYCGCLFGLKSQRESQDKLMDEMFDPINNQVLLESIQERLNLYHQRDECEEKGVTYKIVKERFLNYRLLSGHVKVKKKSIPSYIMAYSTLQNGKMNGRIEYVHQNVYHLNRNEVKLITLKTFNQLSSKTYQSTMELLYNPPSFEEEVNIRRELIPNVYDLSSLIVLDCIDEGKYEIELNSKIYEDVKERLIVEDTVLEAVY